MQGGPNCGFYSSHFWVIIKFRLEALVQRLRRLLSLWGFTSPVIRRISMFPNWNQQCDFCSNICWKPLHFDVYRKRDKLYQKYLKDKISIHKITIFHLRIQSQKIYDHSYMYLIIIWMFIGPFHIVTLSKEKWYKKPICFLGFPQTGEQ